MGLFRQNERGYRLKPKNLMNLLQLLIVLYDVPASKNGYKTVIYRCDMVFEPKFNQIMKSKY